jgi:Fe-S cluster assembly iron-binding protein IscA
MLTLTKEAATTIRSLVGRDLPAGSGLRVAGKADGTGLRISAATAPESGDDVVETGGARVSTRVWRRPSRTRSSTQSPAMTGESSSGS